MKEADYNSRRYRLAAHGDIAFSEQGDIHSWLCNNYLGFGKGVLPAADSVMWTKDGLSIHAGDRAYLLTGDPTDNFYVARVG